MELKFKLYVFNINNNNIDVVIEQLTSLINGESALRNVLIQCSTVQTQTILSAALHANLIRPDSEFKVESNRLNNVILFLSSIYLG